MAMAAEAIIFAINSAIRLGRNAQRAYAKSLSSKSIVLPLPKFSGEPNASAAEEFFKNEDPIQGGAQFLEQLEVIKDIHDRIVKKNAPVLMKETDDYVAHFKLLRSLLQKQQNDNDTSIEEGLKDTHINIDEFVSLLRIRQYDFDRKTDTRPLQMVAGSLVEIGIDYFNRIPGALNEQSASGRTIKHFLGAFDDLSFSDNAELKKHSHKILPQLFITAAETVVDLSQDMTKDPKVQSFIQSAGKGIADDLFGRMKDLDTVGQDEAIQWGRLLLRSTIANSGQYVFNGADRIFDTNEGGDKLIKATGNILLEAILKDPDKLNIKDGMNAETLDRLFESTFSVLAEHPALISNKNGFSQIVTGVSKALSTYSFKRPDLLPELVRLVVENTGAHLNLFWEKDGAPNDAKEGAEALLIKALQLILAEISAPVGDGNWRPHLSKDQLLFMVEELLDYVVQNPAWVENGANGKPLLSTVIRVTLDALAQLPKEERLSATTLEWLLELNLRAVAANQLLLAEENWGENDPKIAILRQALDMVFGHVFDPGTVTAGDRLQLLEDILEYVMEVILANNPDKKGLLLIDLILFKQDGLNLANGFNADLADNLLEAALAVLAAHPELISNKAAFSQIISNVAGALTDGGYKQEDLLVEIVRLTLESAAINAGLFVKVDGDEHEFLLVTFVREILLAISNKPDSTAKWQPVITPAEVAMIVDTLLNELIQHPEWYVKGENGQYIFKEALSAVRKGLQENGKVTLTSEQLEYLLILALRTAATSPKVLAKIPWGTDTEKLSVLERSFSIIASFVFEELHISGKERIERLEELMEYIMDVILTYHPDKKGLILLNLLLFEESDIDYSRGFNEEFSSELIDAALRVMANHADLISNEQSIQQIVSDTANALSAADFRQPGILPEIVRMILENTAMNSGLVLNAAAGTPKFLLVIALQTFLGELSQKSVDGKWQPQITPDDLLLMVENMLDEVVNHPEWLMGQPGQTDTLWNEVVIAVMSALRNLPKECRLHPESLETLMITCLRTSANSPNVLAEIKWFDDATEKVILNKALDILISYVYPPNSAATPERWEMFLNLLDFVLENIIEEYPDKRSLVLIDMLFFESEVDLSRGFDYQLAEDLISATLDIMHAHPDLLTKHEIFRKILSDVSGALRASKTDIKHMLPEFFRLVLFNASGHLETLMNIRPNSPRLLLALALEQTLRVITQKKRGVWRPEFSEEQLLDIVELVLARVVENPQWVGSDKLIQLSLEAIYSAFDQVKNGKTLPYNAVEMLISAGLDAVGQRQHLVLEVITTDGKQQVVLEYALGNLFVELYDTQGNSSGSWTLTQADNLQSLLSHYLLRLAVGPADKATADALNKKVKDAVKQINDNLAFTLDDLLVDLGE